MRLLFGLAALFIASTSLAASEQFDSTIANIESNLCPTPPSEKKATLVPLAQAKCAAKWTFDETDGLYSIFADKKDQCLDVEGGSKNAGARVIAARCTDDAAQRWRIQPIGEGYQIVSVRSGLCLALAGDSSAIGAQVVQQACNGTNARTWRIGEFPGVRSEWSRPFDVGLVAAAAANLPDGRVLLWAADSRVAFSTDLGRTYSAFFDPANNSVSQRLVTETGHDMFCPGTNLLADGTVMVTGGLSSTKTSLFANGVWTIGAEMNKGRGYHGAATLSNGDAFTIGGSWSGGNGDKVGEVWSTNSGWRKLPNFNADPIIAPDPEGVYRGDNHAWLFAVGGGRVFHAGPSVNMNWIDTNGGGSFAPAGARGDDSYSMNGNAVMYDTGKILKLGGAPAYVNAAATSSAHIIDINGGVSVRRIGSMAYARTYANSVVLPNGQVVVIGGLTRALQNTDQGAVLAPELWDPRSERFLRLASMATPRPYHSTAILLPDGRVLAAGGGLCGEGCPANHTNAEILSPPYLFKPNGKPAIRPEITDAPGAAGYGATISVSVKRPVGAFTLVRLASVSHSLNLDQRRIPLRFAGEDSGDEADLEGGPDNKDNDDKRGGGKRHKVVLPSDSGAAIPGYYMLFALGKDGVPAVARMIRLWQ